MKAILDQLPPWVVRVLWTVATVGVAYAIGLVLNAIVMARLGRLAKRTRGEWDDILVGELRKRVPFWSLLIGLWQALAHWPMSPDAHLLAIQVLSILGTASVTLAAAGIVTRSVVSYGATATPPVPVSGLTQNIIKIVITLFGVLVIIRGLGRDITPMLTALGVGGLAVALALQDPLSNLFAGFFVTLAGQFRIGHYIRLDSGVEGYLVDFNWRATRLQALSGNIVIVPNAKLAQAMVTNFNQPAPDLSVGIDLAVDYASDLERVEAVVLEVAREVMRDVPGGVPTAEPSVRFHTFGDFGVKFTVGLRAATFVDQFLIKHVFVKRLHVRFLREGIVIPFPITSLVSRERLPVPPA